MRKKIDAAIAALSAYGGPDPMFQYLLGEIDLAVAEIVQCPHNTLRGVGDAIACVACGRRFLLEDDPDIRHETMREER